MITEETPHITNALMMGVFSFCEIPRSRNNNNYSAASLAIISNASLFLYTNFSAP